MTGELSEMSEIKQDDRDKSMTCADMIADEMQSIVKAAAHPFVAGDTIGRQIARAARVLGLKPGQCKRLWYREDRAILAWEADRLRAWHAAWQERQISRLDAELETLKATIAERNKC